MAWVQFTDSIDVPVDSELNYIIVGLHIEYFTAASAMGKLTVCEDDFARL